MASSAASQSHSHSGQLQLHPPAAGAASMMARVERLDLVVGYLEEMRHNNHGSHSARSASTSPSTPTTFSSSSPPATPRSTNRCRPAEELLRETRAKGSLVDRIAFLESRVLRMEEERLSSVSAELCTLERTTGRLSSSMSSAGGESGSAGSGRKKKGLKSLVKSCVRAGAKLKTKD